MKASDFLRYFNIAPVQLTFAEKCRTALACLLAFLLTTVISQNYADGHSPVLIASLGASAVILFATPGSPMAQPWSFVGGQMLAALIGICTACYIPHLLTAVSVAIGLTVMLMLLLRCLHPPGAATALVPILNGSPSSSPDFDFLLMPVGINVLLMLIIAVLINRLMLHRDYPTIVQTNRPVNTPDTHSGQLVGIEPEDIELAKQGFKEFLDIGDDELCELLTRLHLISVQKNTGSMSCGELMQRNIISVEYDTQVEAAWSLMSQQHLKALPVLDRNQRVIGIVTRYDFLKNLKLTPYQSFQDNWLTFIRPSADITTNKPEAIGHIMTRKVKTLTTDAHISQLIPLVVNEGHHHVPIVDNQGRFLGMVFQSQLLAALFRHLAFSSPGRK